MTMEFSKKSSFTIQKKFSAEKLMKLTKMVKPVLKFLSRKQRTNSVTPSTCNYDVVESAQNVLNESELFHLDFKFHDEVADNEANELAEAEENSRNEELEKRLRENVENHNDVENVGIQTIEGDRITVRSVLPGTYFAIPVHFVESAPGQFTWAPLPDFDICRRGDDEIVTEFQTAEQQTPTVQVA